MDLATFKTQYPNISADDATIQRYLDLFLCQFTGDYGCMADHLQGLFTAHMATYLEGKKVDPTGGLVTSKSVGDVTISSATYLALQGRNPNFFNYTSYGQAFIDTITLYGAGPMMTEPYYG